MAHRVYHWKHGWIPLDHVAASEAGIRSRRDVASAALKLHTVPTADRAQAAAHLTKAAHATGSADLLPGHSGGLSPAALATALDPNTNRSASAITKELEKSPEGRDLVAAIKGFTETRGGVANLRKNIQKTLDGTASKPVEAKTKAFLDAMEKYPTHDTPPLYRGVAVKVDEDTNAWWDAFEGQLQPGKTLNLNASSFSASEKKAAEFERMIGGTRRAGSNHTAVRFVLEGQPHALPVQQLSKFKSEKEWITGGEFEVTSFARAVPGQPYYRIGIRQRKSLGAAS